VRRIDTEAVFGTGTWNVCSMTKTMADVTLLIAAKTPIRGRIGKELLT
jgi:hypothetical protein